MSKDQNNMLLVLGNYLLLVGLLGLGGYLYVTYPENEALGGMVLGSTGVIVGLILPYHLKRIKVVAFNLFPSKGELGKITLYTVIFMTLLVFVAGRQEFISIITNPPGVLPAIYTFLFLLLSATTYALLFWGGILHVFNKSFGPLPAVLITGVLFSLYHLAEFAFTPLTWQFLLLMFIGGVLCSGFTLLAGSVLPTLIAQQVGQFIYFVSLADNPFSEPGGVIATTILLLICSTVYMVIFRKRKVTQASVL